MITQLLKADSGEIWVDGKQIAGQKQQNRKEIKNLYTKIQMVFQTPQDSFDPRRTLGDGIMESVYNHRMSKKEARMRMEQLLQQVELPLELAERAAAYSSTVIPAAAASCAISACTCAL